MNDLEYTFDDMPCEDLFADLQPGETADGVWLLTRLEGVEDEEAEAALAALDEKRVVISVARLPKGGASGAAARRLREEEVLAAAKMDITKLEYNDPLRLYLEEVAALKIGDEALESLEQRASRGEADAMEQLTKIDLKRIVAIAAEHTGWGVLMLDLIQEGSLGLWQAVSICPEERELYIRNAMARSILLHARNTGFSQRLREALEDYRSVDERLLAELGRNPELEEIAQAMHVPPSEAEKIAKMVQDAQLMNRVLPEQPEQEEEEEAETTAVEDTAYFQMRQRIAELLSGLTEADAKLLTLRYGLDNQLPQSAEDTGRHLGMTAQEVSRREAAILAQLRSN